MQLKILTMLSLFLFSASANALIWELNIGDSYYIGGAASPTNASAAADLLRVELVVSNVTGMPIDLDPNNVTQGGGPNANSAIGSDYFYRKYGGNGDQWHVWDISMFSSTDTLTSVQKVPQLPATQKGNPYDQGNQWTAFNILTPNGCGPNCPTTNVPEPATLALFGFGLVAFGFARRRKA